MAKWIQFIREKTKRTAKEVKPILVPISREIQEIIDRWGNEKYRSYRKISSTKGHIYRKERVLETGIGRIKNDLGSVKNYLTKVLKVNLQQMKVLFLYPSL